MRPLLNDASCLQYHDLICSLDGREAMSDDERGAPL